MRGSKRSACAIAQSIHLANCFRLQFPFRLRRRPAGLPQHGLESARSSTNGDLCLKLLMRASSLRISSAFCQRIRWYLEAVKRSLEYFRQIFTPRADGVLRARVHAATPGLHIVTAITDPLASIGRLIDRLQAFLQSHFEIDALRWYWGDENHRIRSRAVGRPMDIMPMAEQSKLPADILPIGNSRVILSKTGNAFVVDAGYRNLSEVLEKPGAFHLPCLTTKGVPASGVSRAERKFPTTAE